ncbi:hypothetical protein BD410DRAFT_303146 [Rickenella mellea]|uniref:Uncharacterized protein n=1 Tax=Rickenella mellea TaxID=50990 RepID=A0A4Y7Q2D2_9AGAM|nr:hypothetical protein BD410DRAFT_303146 [Rickenella mellea]
MSDDDHCSSSTFFVFTMMAKFSSATTSELVIMECVLIAVSAATIERRSAACKGRCVYRVQACVKSQCGSALGTAQVHPFNSIALSASVVGGRTAL